MREMSREEGKDLHVMRHVLVHKEAFVIHQGMPSASRRYFFLKYVKELRMCLLAVVRTFESTMDRLPFTEQQLITLRVVRDQAIHVGE